MKRFRLKQNLTLALPIGVCISCAIGPIYEPPLSRENSELKLNNKSVVVTQFYKAQTELSYLGDLKISQILESAKLYDLSYTFAQYLNTKEIDAFAVKDASVTELKENEVMLRGSIITRSIPMEENFPFPGMLVILLVGNVLPSPAAYKSGVDIMYQYELTDASGRILQSVESKSRVYYKDYYIWGRMFNYQKYEQKLRDSLQEQVFKIITDDLFQ